MLFSSRHRHHPRPRRIVLRQVRSRSEDEIRNTLGVAASEVEECLRECVQRTMGDVPAGWFADMERQQLLGNGRDVPDLVSYKFRGRTVLTVWTRLVGQDLRIELHAGSDPIG